MISGSGTPPGDAVVEVRLYGEPEGEERTELRSYRYDSAMIRILSFRDNPRIIRCFGTGRRARYSTPLFARDSSGVDLPMLLFLQRIAESRDSILSVTITGYVSLGENVDIGEERAARVAETLRTLRPDLVPVIEFSPTRPESIMYRQETPEGRMHNRTVQLLLRLPEFSPTY